LKGSGAIFAICPTMNQLEKLTASLIENEFTDIESTEHILRTIEAREGKTRHSFQGIGHTTYLCFARKAFFDRESKSFDTSDKDSKSGIRKVSKDNKKHSKQNIKKESLPKKSKTPNSLK